MGDWSYWDWSAALRDISIMVMALSSVVAATAYVVSLVNDG